MNQTAEQLGVAAEAPSWSLKSPAVQRAVNYIEKKGGRVTAEELVAYDATHGRRLFNWTEALAAHEWRLQQARSFLNSFRSVVDGMRVRGYINIPAMEDTGQERREYVTTDVISTTPQLRKWVIENCTKRAASVLSELKMWRLSEGERRAVLKQLRQRWLNLMGTPKKDTREH